MYLVGSLLLVLICLLQSKHNSLEQAGDKLPNLSCSDIAIVDIQVLLVLVAKACWRDSDEALD